MIPRYVDVLAERPRTPTEKVKKGDLREAGITSSAWDRQRAGVTLPS